MQNEVWHMSKPRFCIVQKTWLLTTQICFTYNIIVKQFKEDQQKYEKVISDGEKQIAEIDERLAAGDNRRELIEQYTNITKLNRETVDIMIDHIVVGRRIKGTKNYPVEIYWNFWGKTENKCFCLRLFLQHRSYEKASATEKTTKTA